VKTYSTAYAAHLQQPVTTLAICWRITKRDGSVILGTDHDRNIPITVMNIGVPIDSPPSIDLVGVYLARAGITGSDIKSSSDMSVDNMEVRGALQPTPDMQIFDLTVADIESGLLDDAQVTTFRVNWQDPDDFQEVLRYGFLGEIVRTAEGQYTTEVRGLTQVLQQTLGRTCGERCDVRRFGDERCKFPVEAHTVSGTVTAVTSRRRFNTTLNIFDSSAPESPYFRLGRLTWLTGDNVGFPGRVKLDNVGDVLGNLEMAEEFPYTIEVGDTFELEPGCDRSYETCRDVHDNLINFRGPGIFCPGPDEIIRAP
jgi:uncharacterized phage protein (TIGR02218 family)